MSGAGTFRALVELRALLAWRRLRGSRGTAEGVALFVLFMLAVPGSAIFATLVGLGSWRAARAGAGLQAKSIAVILFGLWQSWTAISLSVGDRDATDLRRFLAYPVAPRRVWLLGLASTAVADPFTLFWLALLSGAFAGAAIARPGGWLVALALALAAFATATAALVALLQELLGLVSRSRWVREIALVGGLVAWAAFLAASAVAVERPWLLAQGFLWLRWVAYPAALAAQAAHHLYAGDAAASWPWIGALAAAGALTLAAAYRLALRAARAGGEGGAPRRIAEVTAPGLLARVAGPLVEKELRYLGRHPAVRVYALLLPLLTGAVSWQLSRNPPAGAPELAPALPLLVAAAYVHLVAQAFWLNAFGWERGGARALFLAPLPAERVLRHRNRALAVATLALFLGCGAVAIAAGGTPPPLWAVLGALALHAGLAPVFHGAGNVVSILNPRAVPTSGRRGAPLPALSSLAGLAILSGASGLFGLPVLIAVRLESPWVMPAAWAALGALAYATYRATLPAAGRLLERRRESLLAAVTGDDA